MVARLANVEGGRNVRIITRTPWNPWHRGDGKRGRLDKNHSRCVTYRFECDGRRSPPIPLTLETPFPEVPACPRALAPLLPRSPPSPTFPRRHLSRARNIQTPSPDDLIRANFETLPLSTRPPGPVPPHGSSIFATRRPRRPPPRVGRTCVHPRCAFHAARGRGRIRGAIAQFRGRGFCDLEI